MATSNKKNPHNVESSDLVTTRHTRLKKPPRNLKEWIRLANLIPLGYDVPYIQIQNNEINPDNPELWPRVLEWMHRLPDSLRSELLTYDTYPETRPAFRAVFVVAYFEKIRFSHSVFHTLTRPESEQAFDYMEELLSAMRYAELPYLRRCGKQDCGRIFYAGRTIQPGCTPAHSRAIRRDKKRKQDKLNARYKRKKQRAQTSDASSKRP
jgi:hypothetical protein